LRWKAARQSLSEKCGMERIDHQYERGWKRYGFDNQPFETKMLHGSEETISVYSSFKRGLHKPHITFAEIGSTSDEAIGMHIHRDEPTGDDFEEWYVIIDGTAEMTFSNGDVVLCHAGDLLVTYPGTGHSFRAVDGTCRIISICPEAFRYGDIPVQTDVYPEKFDPRIRVSEMDNKLCAVHAVCTVCGAEWHRSEGDPETAALPVWSKSHRHGEQELLP
jgi:hypothetical protein